MDGATKVQWGFKGPEYDGKIQFVVHKLLPIVKRFQRKVMGNLKKNSTKQYSLRV